MTSALTDLPGVVVSVSSSAPQTAPPTDTGVAFFCGVAAAGPIDHAVKVRNMDEFVSVFGARDTGGFLYDACDTAFHSGVTTIWVGRDAGPGAVNDTVTLKDNAAANAVTLSSRGPTHTGWSATVTAGTVGGTIVITITDANGKVITFSPNCAAQADVLSWGQNNAYISAAAVNGNLPVVAAAAAFAGGADDRASIGATTAARQTKLLSLFPKLLGPGQLAYPGSTLETFHVALANVASLTNRVALLDMPDTGNAASLVTQRLTFLADANLLPLAETFVAHLADWQKIPGITRGTTRTVPPSGFWAGLIAANDSLTGNPNNPAAGSSGILSYSLGRSQLTEWVDIDRNTLNQNNINVVKSVYGSWRIYSYRSGANPAVDASDTWKQFSNVRLRMRIVNDLDILGEDYVFSQLDGKGVTIATFNAACMGRMTTYWSLGALYGATPSDAFSVSTAPPVNTPTTAAAQQLNVVIGAKMSPFAEKVYFGLTKMAITDGGS